MKKILVMVVALLLLSLLFVGCTPDEAETESISLPAIQSDQNTTQPVTSTYENTSHNTEPVLTTVEVVESYSLEPQTEAVQTSEVNQAPVTVQTEPSSGNQTAETLPEVDPDGLEIEDDVVVTISDGQGVGGN